MVPNSGTPSTAYVLQVRNTGTVTDTFDVALGGVLGRTGVAWQRDGDARRGRADKTCRST